MRTRFDSDFLHEHERMVENRDPFSINHFEFTKSIDFIEIRESLTLRCNTNAIHSIGYYMSLDQFKSTLSPAELSYNYKAIAEATTLAIQLRNNFFVRLKGMIGLYAVIDSSGNLIEFIDHTQATQRVYLHKGQYFIRIKNRTEA